MTCVTFAMPRGGLDASARNGWPVCHHCAHRPGSGRCNRHHGTEAHAQRSGPRAHRAPDLGSERVHRCRIFCARPRPLACPAAPAGYGQASGRRPSSDCRDADQHSAAGGIRPFLLKVQNRAARQLPDAEQKKAERQAYRQAMNAFAKQAVARSLLRDLYSADQLREKMTWFWFNHFNVHLRKGDISATIGDYEENALRRNALGRFRNLLRATATHPAMLRYLDNAQNAKGHLNENYAREIMELHTMGVGSGYTQDDVQELTRILTGVGVNFQLADTDNIPKP